ELLRSTRRVPEPETQARAHASTGRRQVGLIGRRPDVYARLVSCVPLFALLCGCDRQAGAPASAASSVVIYCSVDEEFARPLLAEFEKQSGITVQARYDTEAGKTTGLVERLRAERNRPRADVFWSSEIFGTIELAGQGLLSP